MCECVCIVHVYGIGGTEQPVLGSAVPGVRPAALLLLALRQDQAVPVREDGHPEEVPPVGAPPAAEEGAGDQAVQAAGAEGE